MDMKAILDQLLHSGKDAAQKTKDFAEQKLGVPPQGENRDAMLSGLGKGALAGGLLALLLGTKTGRGVTGKAIKYGSLAAIAGFAYKAYRDWQTSQPNQPQTNSEQDASIQDLTGDQANHRSLVLIRAMIAAANADGHIDEAERANIREQLHALGLENDARQVLEKEIGNPLSPQELAALVDSPAAASEVYLLSSAIVDEANPMEKEYLKELSSALKLPPSLIQRLQFAND